MNETRSIPGAPDGAALGEPDARRLTGPETPYISEHELRVALDETLRDTFRPLTLGLSASYFILMLGTLVFGIGAEHPVVPITAFATGAIMLGAHVALRRWTLPTRWTYPFGLGLVILFLAVNSVLHLELRAGQVTNYALLIAAAGFFVLSLRWLLVILALSAATWLVVVWQLYPDTNPTQVALSLLGSVSVALIIHWTRVDTLRRLQRLRLVNLRGKAELERSVAELLQSEERFRQLAAATSEGIAIHHDGVIVDANPALAEMFGYSLDELIGRPALDLAAPESRDAMIRRLHNPEPAMEVVIGLRKDGSQFPLELRSAHAPSQGHMMRVVSMRDIAEQQTAAAEREKLIQELDAFAHTVAHDLKSPLSLALGFAEMLHDEYQSFSEEERQHYLGLIVQGVQKMDTIINELLLLSQMRSSQIAVRPLDMAAIVREAQARLAYLIEEQQATVVLPASWPVALGYAPWIEEVWVNYLSNALRYGGTPPHVELGATLLDDGRVRFWVRDNGPGLSQEQQAKLFTPFTQVGEVNTKGHGLGLSIVLRIIERLGGEVGVESTPGQGSVFSFVLPAAPQVSEPAVSDAAPARQHTP